MFVEQNSPTLEKVRADFSIDRVKHLISHPHDHDFSKDTLKVDMQAMERSKQLGKQIRRLKGKKQKKKKTTKSKEGTKLKKLEDDYDASLSALYPDFFHASKRIKGGHLPPTTKIHAVKPSGYYDNK